MRDTRMKSFSLSCWESTCSIPVLSVSERDCNAVEKVLRKEY